MKSEILFFVSLLVIMIAQFYFSYRDLVFRSMRRRYIVALYPMAFYCAWYLYGFTIDFFFGGFLVAISFYLTDLLFKIKVDSNHVYIGAIDILGAPLYTVWFGFGCLGFLTIYFILYSVYIIPVVRKYMEKFAKDSSYSGYVPMLILMQASFLICGLLMML